MFFSLPKCSCWSTAHVCIGGCAHDFGYSTTSRVYFAWSASNSTCCSCLLMQSGTKWCVLFQWYTTDSNTRGYREIRLYFGRKWRHFFRRGIHAALYCWQIILPGRLPNSHSFVSIWRYVSLISVTLEIDAHRHLVGSIGNRLHVERSGVIVLLSQILKDFGSQLDVIAPASALLSILVTTHSMSQIRIDCVCLSLCFVQPLAHWNLRQRLLILLRMWWSSHWKIPMRRNDVANWLRSCRITMVRVIYLAVFWLV